MASGVPPAAPRHHYRAHTHTRTGTRTQCDSLRPLDATPFATCSLMFTPAKRLQCHTYRILVCV
jgi:hypothetical protein